MTIDHRDYDEWKRCSKCEVRKPRHAFNKKTVAPDGLQYYCRKCDNEAERTGFVGECIPVDRPGGYAKTSAPNPKDLIGETKAPTLSVIPSTALIHLGQAMVNGSAKYGKFNWREHPVQSDIYLDAMLRHVMAWQDGEENAEDSGVHHLGHAMACLGILLDAQEAGNLIDQRVTGFAADLLERVKK